jgi:hypothetical protein
MAKSISVAEGDKLTIARLTSLTGVVGAGVVVGEAVVGAAVEGAAGWVAVLSCTALPHPAASKIDAVAPTASKRIMDILLETEDK